MSTKTHTDLQVGTVYMETSMRNGRVISRYLESNMFQTNDVEENRTHCMSNTFFPASLMHFQII
jgi:hypothetical protein